MDSLPSSCSSLPHLPDQTVLHKTVTEFIKSLQVTEEQAWTIEQKTIEQRNSPNWFEVIKFRLYGVLEIKCPYSQWDVTPIEACDSPGFCCCTTIIGGKSSTYLFT